MTPIEMARMLHEQAKRNLKRLEEDRKHQRSNRLDRRWMDQKEAVARTLARLQELEQAS